MRWISCAVLLLIALTGPAAAQSTAPGSVFYSLADLQAIFVGNQQYFVFDTEGTSSTQLNHLHFSHIDTTTGAFSGSLVGPTLPEGFTVEAQTVPVTGTITITDQSTPWFTLGNYYGITFSWILQQPCGGAGASYNGAITFQGYEGSGKMHATIAGIENANWGYCGLGAETFNPLPFSGQLTK